MLMTERSNDERAIAYDLQALAIRVQIGDPQTARSVQRLAQARSRLGTTAFTRIASQSPAEASLANLRELLDHYDTHDTGPGDQPTG